MCRKDISNNLSLLQGQSHSDIQTMSNLTSFFFFTKGQIIFPRHNKRSAAAPCWKPSHIRARTLNLHHSRSSLKLTSTSQTLTKKNNKKNKRKSSIPRKLKNKFIVLSPSGSGRTVAFTILDLLSCAAAMGEFQIGRFWSLTQLCFPLLFKVEAKASDSSAAGWR